MDISNVINASPGFEFISFEKSLELSEHHAAHCCIYSPYSTPVTDGCMSSALVSMQMRFDGRLGFHGGIVDKKNIVEGLNRELVEEINLNKKFHVTDKDYLFTHLDNSEKKMCLHMYAKEVSITDFKTIEKEVFEAEDFGKETMGVCRVPMFTMHDGYRGLPAFLNNNFIKEARNQLLNVILLRKLMTPEEVKVVLEKSQKGIK